MKKQQIQNKIAELQNKLKQIESEELQEKDKPIIIICKELKKEFRIYKWDKIFKDFPMPKDFNWCEYQDFIYLYDTDLIILEKYPICYYCKNISKKNIKNKWQLSGLCLGRSLDLGSNNDYLDNSDSNGREVISRSLK